jgi:hypothetical protein
MLALSEGFYGSRNVTRRKPTRRDLLVVIERLQRLVSRAGAAMSDRNPNRAEEVAAALDRAFDLCVDARSHDDPITRNYGPWGDE